MMRAAARAIALGLAVLLAGASPAASLQGQVLGPTGQPLVGATVCAQPLGEEEASVKQWRVVQTDAQGRWRLEGVAAGDWRLSALHEGVGMATTTVNALGAGESRDTPQLTPQAAAHTLRVAVRGRGVPADAPVFVYVLHTGEMSDEGFDVLGAYASPTRRTAGPGSTQGTAPWVGEATLPLPAGNHRVLARVGEVDSDDWRSIGEAVVLPGQTAPLTLALANPTPRQPALRAELLAMMAADQAARSADSAEALAKMQAVDAKHERRLREILKAGWPALDDVGRDGLSALWLLFQHAPPEVLAQVLPQVQAAAEAGELSRQDWALMDDRHRMNQGLPQRHGSQFKNAPNGELVVYTVEDPAGLDARRAAIGLEPFAAYERRLKRLHAPAPAASAASAGQ